MMHCTVSILGCYSMEFVRTAKGMCCMCVQQDSCGHRVAAFAGVAAEPVTQTMVDQSRRRAPDASRERGPALASTLGDAPPDCRQMRVRSAALKLHAARLAAERAGLSAPTGSDVASPSAEASEDGTSDASGAASLAEGAAVGDDDPAGGRPQTLCGWLLRLVGRR